MSGRSSISVELLMASMTVSRRGACLALFLYILLAAAELQGTEHTNSDTLQQADSMAGADSLPSAPSLAANLSLLKLSYGHLL